jgi:hypothetical protein
VSSGIEFGVFLEQIFDLSYAKQGWIILFCKFCHNLVNLFVLLSNQDAQKLIAINTAS